MYTSAELDGARWILTEALEAKSGDSVVVIHDEHTECAATCLREVGLNQANLRMQLHFIPHGRQKELSSNSPATLPKNLRKIIDGIHRVVFLQTPDPAVHEFRMQTLRYSESKKGLRAASMPGVMKEHFRFCQGDLGKIQDRCELVLALLLRSRNANITTITHGSGSITLSMRLGTHIPIKSTGRIRQNSWGNVPSGETFIVPDEGTASGEVAINGSMLDYVFPKGRELVLEFTKGRVTRLQNLADDLVPHVRRLLFDSQGREVYRNCSILSELGIGTNEYITELTGLPVFDEKILGTVHLGLGKSTQFGGNTDCRVHNDYVICSSMLSLDGVKVTEGGHFALRPEDVYPNWRSIVPRTINQERHFHLGQQAAVFVKSDMGDEAFISVVSPRGKEDCTVRIGDHETSRLAARLLSTLASSRIPKSLPQLAAAVPSKMVPAESVIPTLELLLQYRLVEQ